jgi:hypothetical protein
MTVILFDLLDRREVCRFFGGTKPLDPATLYRGIRKPSAPMKADPPPFRDLTAGMSMPKEALLEMATAVPNVVIRQIVTADRVRAELAPLARGNVGPPTPAQLNRTGYRSAAPLDVPGIVLADKIVDAQDQRDKADLIDREARRLAQTKAKPDAA